MIQHGEWYQVAGRRMYAVRVAEEAGPLELEDLAVAYAPYAALTGCGLVEVLGLNRVVRYRVERRGDGSVRCAPEPVDGTVAALQSAERNLGFRLLGEVEGHR